MIFHKQPQSDSSTCMLGITTKRRWFGPLCKAYARCDKLQGQKQRQCTTLHWAETVLCTFLDGDLSPMSPTFSLANRSITAIKLERWPQRCQIANWPVHHTGLGALAHIFDGSSGRLLEETDKLVSSTERKKQADERETEESQQSHYAMSRCLWLCMSASGTHFWRLEWTAFERNGYVGQFYRKKETSGWTWKRRVATVALCNVSVSMIVHVGFWHTFLTARVDGF